MGGSTFDILGRDRDLADVVARLRDRRLVTLTGPGGIGKTALARVAAAEVGLEYAYGAVLVDLTRIDQPDAVDEAIAGQLGYADFESLIDSPSDQPALVFVDNCEHVLDAAATAIDRILVACKMPTFLATSRAPLDIADESIVTVGPLPLPAEGAIDTDAAALQLLIARVRDHGIDPGTLDVALLADICRRLDGVPLAIELAAARLRTSAPGELLAELDSRPHALARRHFRGQSSHRSVAELVGWSTDLLEPPARTAFDRLGVFAGPFTIDMARAVAVDGAEPVPFRDLLDELVESSLVVIDGSGDEAWYRLLHPVRVVALESLRESGELDAVRSRFVDRVVDDAVDVIVRGAAAWDATTLADLIALYDNITASLRWLVDHDDGPERALTLLAVMWGIVHQTHTAEIAALGETVLDRWDGEDSAMWPDAVATVATCWTIMGRYQESIDLATRALGVADRATFAPTTLRRVLAQTYRILGDAERSIETFRAGAAAAAERGVNGFARELLSGVGVVLAASGRPDDGLAEIDRVRRDAQAHGDTINEAWARVCRAHVLLDVDPSAAARAAADSLARSREIDYPIGRTCSLRVLARARLALGDGAAAAAAVLELLDEMLARGGFHDLRLAADVAAEILADAGDARAADLAATARELPITSLVVPVELPIAALSDRAGGAVLSMRDAYVLMRSELRAIAEQGGTNDDVRSAPAPVDPDAAEAGMIGEGDVIRIDYGGVTVRLNRSKGLGDLAQLVARPSREVSCLELMGAGVVGSSTETEALDATARRQYEERVRELQAEIEHAEAGHDIGTVDRLRVEMDFLVDELTAALGLGGRSRTTSDPAERARSAVTQRLRSTIKRIAEHHPELGAHLRASVSTGLYCTYRPADETVWTISIDP